MRQYVVTISECFHSQKDKYNRLEQKLLDLGLVEGPVGTWRGHMPDEAVASIGKAHRQVLTIKAADT
jgi:hypothetical protein